MNFAKIEDRKHSKFTVKLGRKNGEITNALWKIYGDNAPKKSAVSQRITHFKMEWNNVEASRQTITSICQENMYLVRVLIEEDQQ